MISFNLYEFSYWIFFDVISLNMMLVAKYQQVFIASSILIITLRVKSLSSFRSSFNMANLSYKFIRLFPKCGG